MGNLASLVLRTEALRRKAADWCMRADRSPELIEVVFRNYKCRRSLQQNSLFHKWVALLADHLGYDRKDMKEIVKQELLGTRDVMVKGVLYRFTPCTSGLTVAEFAKLLTDLERWSAVEHGFLLPPPVQYGYEEDIARVTGRA